MNSLGMRFKQIPAGTFTHIDKSGEETSCSVTQPYHIGVYEVTQGQFSRVVGRNPVRSELLPIHDNLPVSNITSYDALKFCQKLSDLDSEKKTGRSYRLPTELEWELACRGGTASRFSFGEVGDFQRKFANFATVKAYTPLTSGSLPSKVGSYPANDFGLYDMHGNVCELCMDKAGKWAASTPDFVRLGNRAYTHVLRGGDFFTLVKDSGSSYRDRHYEYTGNVRALYVGFRVVCVTRKQSELDKKVLAAQAAILGKK